MATMMKKAVAYIPEHMLNRVEKIQRDTGVSYAELFRRALEAHLTKIEGERNANPSK